MVSTQASKLGLAAGRAGGLAGLAGCVCVCVRAVLSRHPGFPRVRVAGVARKSPSSEVHVGYLPALRGVRVSAHGFPMENAPRARVHRQQHTLITTLSASVP